MSTLDTLHYEGNLIDKIKELERRLAALEHTELSGVVGPVGATGATGITGATGPAGPGSPAGAVEGDLVYFDAVPEAVVLNIGTATQLLQVNAGATAPEWVTAGAANLADRARTLWVPATECENVTDGTYENQVLRGWEMVDGKDCTCYGSFRCPADYASALTIQGIFESPSAGNARMRLRGYYSSSGQAYTTHATTNNTVDEAILADINDQMTTPVSMGSIVVGDYAVVECEREGSHVNDTVGDVVYFVGFLVSYTADM